MTVATLPPKIDGGKYSVIDTQDGFKILKDVPIFSVVAKGTKGAPRDIDKEWLDKAVEFSKIEYEKGKFLAPVHEGHHDLFGANKLSFLGYFIPRRVEMYQFAQTVLPTVFADLKLTAEAMEKIGAGKLAYASVEIRDWDEPQFGSLALMATEPPFWRYALITTGETTVDPAAKFDALLSPRFEGEKPPSEKDKDKDKDKDDHVKCCGHCAGYGKSITRMAKMLGISEDSMNTPPDATPIEPNADKDKKMSADPEVVAKFAAQSAELSELKKRLDDRDSSEKRNARVAKAKTALNGFVLPPNVDEFLSMFADDEKKLDEMVAHYQKIAPKIPPKTFTEFESAPVNMTDPVLAKYNESPDKLEKAAKFLAEYNALSKTAAGKAASFDAAKYVEMQFKLGR